jgi:hypothetical protein
VVTLPSSLEAYLCNLKTAHADRLFKATDPRSTPAERQDYYADARCIQREIDHLVTCGSTHVRLP